MLTERILFHDFQLLINIQYQTIKVISTKNTINLSEKKEMEKQIQETSITQRLLEKYKPKGQLYELKSRIKTEEKRVA